MEEEWKFDRKEESRLDVVSQGLVKRPGSKCVVDLCTERIRSGVVSLPLVDVLPAISICTREALVCFGLHCGGFVSIDLRELCIRGTGLLWKRARTNILRAECRRGVGRDASGPQTQERRG